MIYLCGIMSVFSDCKCQGIKLIPICTCYVRHIRRECISGVEEVAIHITVTGEGNENCLLLDYSNTRPPNRIKCSCFTCDANTTCDMFSRNNSQYAWIIWTFPSHPSSANLFRVVLSGSQPSSSGSAFWFVRRENKSGMLSECKVQEEELRNSRVCALSCRCLVPSCACGYLHYRVQFPSPMNSILGLCYFEFI